MSVDLLKSMDYASKLANVEPTATTMVWASVFATQVFTKQLTEAVWLELHAHHQVQETIKVNVFATPD